jgi:hypothetical protein
MISHISRSTALWSAAISIALTFSGHAAGLPKVFCDDARVLATNKTALANGDAGLEPALKHLLKDAASRLNEKPHSVVDKQQVPSSGDKHDFMSQVPYFWRDMMFPFRGCGGQPLRLARRLWF